MTKISRLTLGDLTTTGIYFSRPNESDLILALIRCEPGYNTGIYVKIGGRWLRVEPTPGTSLVKIAWAEQGVKKTLTIDSDRARLN